jgi:hypothetical protein
LSGSVFVGYAMVLQIGLLKKVVLRGVCFLIINLLPAPPAVLCGWKTDRKLRKSTRSFCGGVKVQKIQIETLNFPSTSAKSRLIINSNRPNDSITGG